MPADATGRIDRGVHQGVAAAARAFRILRDCELLSTVPEAPIRISVPRSFTNLPTPAAAFWRPPLARSASSGIATFGQLQCGNRLKSDLQLVRMRRGELKRVCGWH